MPANSGREDWGIWAPVVTPFREDLSPDPGQLRAQCEACLDQGCHGIVLFGTTGEAASLTVSERKSLLEQVVSDEVPPGKLMLGTGRCALPDTVNLTQHGLSLGLTTMLMLPPFYFKGVSDEGLYRAYAEVIDRVADDRLRLFLYHFPKLSSVPISHAVIDRLINQYGNVITGIKDSTGDEVSTFGFIERYPDLAILPGTERFLHAALLLGAKGCITASANVNARALRDFWNAHVSKSPDAEALQAGLTRIRLALESAPTIPGLKALLAGKSGIQALRMPRPPLVELAQEEEANLLKTLEKAGFPWPSLKE